MNPGLWLCQFSYHVKWKCLQILEARFTCWIKPLFNIQNKVDTILDEIYFVHIEMNSTAIIYVVWFPFLAHFILALGTLFLTCTSSILLLFSKHSHFTSDNLPLNTCFILSCLSTVPILICPDTRKNNFHRHSLLLHSVCRGIGWLCKLDF